MEKESEILETNLTFINMVRTSSLGRFHKFINDNKLQVKEMHILMFS